jgi:hypothetical protein
METLETALKARLCQRGEDDDGHKKPTKKLLSATARKRARKVAKAGALPTEMEARTKP